ncbi:flagellar hook-length control protein FliK [Shewanella chilikensis]|uniref:flagellar hook-length control protein FliK n=1 Tax=Shewanella chilikensis TaxID=558541 RepID=UPI001F373CDB|nr:flagellar hook-length control protein FliK [Shewanella chilikensis]MCE9788831.1 flagellar hook-length control protein FliK [Shewanella chilikensis]
MQQLSNILFGNAGSKGVATADTLQFADNEAFSTAYQEAQTKFSLDSQGVKPRFPGGSLDSENLHAEQAVDVSLILGQIAMGKNLPSEDGTMTTEADEQSLLTQIAALTGLKEDEIKAMSPEEQIQLLENLKLSGAELGMVATDSQGGAELNGADESEQDSLKLAAADEKGVNKDDSKAEDETIDAPLQALDKTAATVDKAKSQQGEQQMGWADADKSVRKAATQDGIAAMAREAVLNAAEEESDKILAQSAVADKAKTDAAGKLGAAVATAVGADGKGDKAAKDVLAGVLKAEVKGAQTAAEVRSPVSDAIHQALKGDAASTQTDISPFQQQLHQQGVQPPQRGEMAQYQLSLRQGMEQSLQTADMVQRFAPVMRQQLIAMVSNGVQQAEIRLDPPELGAMMVRVQVNGDQTQVQFHVTQTQTRDMLEQAMPRLRDMLQEQGMNLAESHISQGGREQGEQHGGNGSGFAQETANGEISAEETVQSTNHTTSYGSGIDYYA